MWKDLTGNVNLLAANLTTQVRAIAEVATAVTQGDLTRSIQVDAKGEVSELKDNLNTMIANLRETTERKPGAGLVENQYRAVHQHAPGPARPLHRREDIARRSRAARPGPARHHLPNGGGQRRDTGPPAPRGLCPAPKSARAHSARRGDRRPVRVEKQRILITDVPSDYTQISSSLGESAPSSIVVLPLLFEGTPRLSSSWHRCVHLHPPTLFSSTSLPRALAWC